MYFPYKTFKQVFYILRFRITYLSLAQYCCKRKEKENTKN